MQIIAVSLALIPFSNYASCCSPLFLKIANFQALCCHPFFKIIILSCSGDSLLWVLESHCSWSFLRGVSNYWSGCCRSLASTIGNHGNKTSSQYVHVSCIVGSQTHISRCQVCSEKKIININPNPNYRSIWPYL